MRIPLDCRFYTLFIVSVQDDRLSEFTNQAHKIFGELMFWFDARLAAGVALFSTLVLEGAFGSIPLIKIVEKVVTPTNRSKIENPSLPSNQS